MKSPYSSERRAARRQSLPDEGNNNIGEDQPNHRTSLRSSYLSSRAASGRSTASSSSTISTERMSSRNFSSLTHEDEIERIREMRARRLRQEAESAPDEGSGTGLDNIMEHMRQRRSEEIGQIHSADSNDSSHTRNTPTIMSRRELEDAGMVRRDRRSSSRLSSVETEGEEANAPLSSYSRTRLERRTLSAPVEDLASGDGPRATTRSDIEARMAARRSSRRQSDSDTVGNTTQMTLDELRSRREESRILLSDRTRGSSAEPRALSDVEAYNDDEEESNGKAKLSTRERIRQRAERRGVPRRSKSVDEDLMTIRSSARNLQENTEYGDNLEPKDEIEARRLERQNRPALLASIDLSARLKERREARAAEREAREREKKESSEMGLIRRLSRSSTTEGQTSDYHGSIPDLEFSDDETEGDSDAGWSVRLCVISAMDLPLNVVPNIPLYPMVKLGLVRPNRQLQRLL
jgi:hypothetical protein